MTNYHRRLALVITRLNNIDGHKLAPYSSHLYHILSYRTKAAVDIHIEFLFLARTFTFNLLLLAALWTPFRLSNVHSWIFHPLFSLSKYH